MNAVEETLWMYSSGCINANTQHITETKMSSFWWNFHHWLHWKLSFWQLSVQPVMKISSKWRHFRFSDVLHTLCVCKSVNDWLNDAPMPIIKWKHFPRYWALCEGNPPVTGLLTCKGQRRGALMFSLVCAWTNSWVNNRDSGGLRRHRSHYDVIVMHDTVRNTDLKKKDVFTLLVAWQYCE